MDDVDQWLKNTDEQECIDTRVEGITSVSEMRRINRSRTRTIDEMNEY